MFSDIQFRLRALFRRQAMESELDLELRFHFERQVEKYRDMGMSAGEASSRARLMFGGIDQVKDECRDARGIRWLIMAAQDITSAWEARSRRGRSSVLAVVTLALGTSACFVTLSLADPLLFRPGHDYNLNRTLALWRKAPVESFLGSNYIPWSAPEVQILTERTRSFASLGAFKYAAFTLLAAGSTQLLDGIEVSADFFPALGAQALLGRTLSTADVGRGEHSVVLSYHLWSSSFAKNPKIVGEHITLNGVHYTVVGVMPPTFIFPDMGGMAPTLTLPEQTQLWVPLIAPSQFSTVSKIGLIGKLKSGVSAIEAQEEISNLDDSLSQAIPQHKLWSSEVVDLEEQMTSQLKQPVILLLFLAGFLLFVSFINIATLTLIRTQERLSEFNLRAALGASRWRLFSQLMMESLILILSSEVAGLFIGLVFCGVIANLWPAAKLHPEWYNLRPQVAASLVVAIFLIGILICGGQAVGIRLAINGIPGRSNSPFRNSGRAFRIRNGVLLIHGAFSLLLLYVTALFSWSAYLALHEEPGFAVSRADQIYVFQMTLPPRYKELSLLKRTHQQILSRLKDSPGIRNAAFASEVPMGGMPDVIALHVLKQPIRSPKEPVASYFLVSPSYFPVIGAHLREGRLIADSDSPDSLPVAVINRTMAERYWPGEDAVGRQIEVGSQRTLRTIVGVIDDVKQTSFREEPTAEMFISYAQSMNGAFPSMNSVQYAIQSTGNANLISSTVGNIVRTIGGEVLMSDFARLSTWVDESMSKDKLLTVIVGGFSIAMLFLTCLGTYGIVRESMTQRKRDFAICMALGASRQAVTISLLRDACLIILSSVVLAAPLVWATTRVFAPLLYHVQPWSPFTFVAVSLLTASTILFSCYKPAKDAFNLSPIMILRGE